ncbi:CPBP family intramembrane glutamic endopeptidase [Halogranum rubrum]|uniref:Caax amino terminal protease n=1 Tax=Halogranum salarium B-1 TaxID=1210908 RepID=J3EXQ9_9EURY|nr:type II CAAX endopeptidase family protein [Halogranum salarium]EJN59967.1 caax amino terminal protease [Halogranum salarium B-1]
MSLQQSDSHSIETRRVAIFLVVAYGVAWATAAALFLTGGLTDSPELLPGLGITLATVLLPTAYMFAPALGNVAARLLTGEGRKDLQIRPHLRGSLRVYAVAWFAPVLLTLVGAGVYFAVFSASFDPELTTYTEALRQAAGGDIGIDPWTLVAIQLVAAVTIAPLINMLFAFGEEFGWRAYLLPKLLPLGTRQATLVVGLVWGAWHWPLIAMGYNYGFEYPGAPWTGFLAMCWFTLTTGVFLAWVTLRSESVWPAAIGHGAINAVAGLSVLFVAGQPNPLVGPTPLGLVGGLGWTVAAAWLLWRSEVFTGTPPMDDASSSDTADATTAEAR